MSERDRDRPKKSWRELDAQRDRAGRPAAPQPRSGQSAQHEAQASKQYRAQLDALFEKGEVVKFAEKMAASGRGGNAPTSATAKPAEPAKPSDDDAPRPRAARAPAPAPTAPTEDPRVVLRKKIVEAIGRDEISRAVDRYAKAHGMPADFELLEQALEHNKTERQQEALAALEKLLERDKPKRSRTLIGKLRFIEETSDDEELRQFAARIRAKL